MAINDYLKQTKADFKKFQDRNQLKEYKKNRSNKHLYVKCRECGNSNYSKELQENHYVCTCGS